MPEIVGLGAVNLDYIIESRNARSSDAGSAEHQQLFDDFVYGSERAVTDDEMQRLLHKLAPLHPVAGPGGSALNTMASIAALGAANDSSGATRAVGYIGICGRTVAGTFSFPAWFSSLGIDTRYVEIDEQELTGVCLSYTSDGQRSMLTAPGANRSIMSYLDRCSSELTDYLRQAKVVHVTSFADLTDIQPLLRLLQSLKAVAPEVRLSCDPGALWTGDNAPEGVDQLMAMSDVLLLNSREFDWYTGRSVVDAGAEAAAETALLGRPCPPGAVIVRKGAVAVELFEKSGREVIANRYPNRHVLGGDEIVDDTGAGDAFAAGFLPALTEPNPAYAKGVELGMALAAEKLRWPGLGGLHRYDELRRHVEAGWDDRRDGHG